MTPPPSPFYSSRSSPSSSPGSAKKYARDGGNVPHLSSSGSDDMRGSSSVSDLSQGSDTSSPPPSVTATVYSQYSHSSHSPAPPARCHSHNSQDFGGARARRNAVGFSPAPPRRSVSHGCGAAGSAKKISSPFPPYMPSAVPRMIPASPSTTPPTSGAAAFFESSPPPTLPLTPLQMLERENNPGSGGMSGPIGSAHLMSGPMTLIAGAKQQDQTTTYWNNHASRVDDAQARTERPRYKKLGLGLLALVAALVLAAVSDTHSLAEARSSFAKASSSINVSSISAAMSSLVAVTHSAAVAGASSLAAAASRISDHGPNAADTYASYEQREHQKQQECCDGNPCTSDYYSQDIKACKFSPIAGCTNNAAMADLLPNHSLRPRCYDANPCTVDYYDGKICTFPPIPGCGNGARPEI